MQVDPGTRWELTDHSVARFRQRIAPDLDPEQARVRLIEVLAEGMIYALPGNDGYCDPRGGALVFRAIHMGPPAVSFRFVVSPQRGFHRVLTVLERLTRYQSHRIKEARRPRRRQAPEE